MPNAQRGPRPFFLMPNAQRGPRPETRDPRPESGESPSEIEWRLTCCYGIKSRKEGPLCVSSSLQRVVDACCLLLKEGKKSRNRMASRNHSRRHAFFFLIVPHMILLLSIAVAWNQERLPSNVRWQKMRPLLQQRTQTPPSAKDCILFATNEDGRETVPKATIYKDDCFGFTTFVAGIAVQDYVFTGIFAALSLIGDILTRVGILPPDPKRPYIVDRKVPGAVALLTLLFRYLIADFVFDVETFQSVDFDADLARNVQLAFCIFSAVTAFLDIRWRDRFDYPNDPV